MAVAALAGAGFIFLINAGICCIRKKKKKKKCWTNSRVKKKPTCTFGSENNQRYVSGVYVKGKILQDVTVKYAEEILNQISNQYISIFLL